MLIMILAFQTVAVSSSSGYEFISTMLISRGCVIVVILILVLFFYGFLMMI